jgi:hypothetical protein
MTRTEGSNTCEDDKTIQEFFSDQSRTKQTKNNQTNLQNIQEFLSGNIYENGWQLLLNISHSYLHKNKLNLQDHI